jgi:uncharacterized protein YceH (UPF0502 family)
LPLATQLERRPGQKELRFAHLLSGVPTYDAVDAPEPAAASGPRGPDRVAALEATVEELRREVADLRSQLDAFRKQFE